MLNTPDKYTLSLWEMILKELPKEIRSLEHFCNLVKFDAENNIAEINVANQSVVKIINEQISNIEKAFEAVMRNPVKIHLSCIEAETPKFPTEDIQITQERVSTFQSEICQQSNQGLGALHKWKGLNFRSKSEIKIAEVLDKRGILFFPNVLGRVSSDGRRVNREIDFLICHEGKWGILECDGKKYHQTAADDHARDRDWRIYGIWCIERFSSDECYNYPEKVVDKFLYLLRLSWSQKNN